LAPSRISTLAALDSTRLQTALAQHFNVRQDAVTGCRTYGGHGEMMAVFASTARISGRPLQELIGTAELPEDKWEAIKQHVRQGGKRIIQLRGRSSFQSPSHQSLVMIKGVIEGGGYPWPAGAYVNDAALGFTQTLMAMETSLGSDGVSWTMPKGTEEEIAELRASAKHLVKLRDEVIGFGVLPPLDAWGDINPNL
jgi:malate dehydrogenase